MELSHILAVDFWLQKNFKNSKFYDTCRHIQNQSEVKDSIVTHLGLPYWTLSFRPMLQSAVHQYFSSNILRWYTLKDTNLYKVFAFLAHGTLKRIFLINVKLFPEGWKLQGNWNWTFQICWYFSIYQYVYENPSLELIVT